MTLPFDVGEDAEAVEVAVELITPGGRGVSALEFFAEGEGEGDDEADAGLTGESESAAGERAAQMRAMIDAAREEATMEARRAFEWEMEVRLGQERARVEQVSVQFAKDRERYFGAAEGQVVRLALAVARRVLAREVAADAMHLAGTVRAALARVQDGSSPVLRVSGEESEAWRAMFVGGGVEVVRDDSLGEGECVLETNVGRVELGVEVQMGEIERGFGELLHRQGE